MKQYHIKVFDELVPVSEEVYQVYYKMRRREKYLVERDQAHGLLSYHALDTDGFQGESVIIDDAPSVEDTVIHAMMLDKLKESLKLLNQEDRQLLLFLFSDRSESALAKELGIARSTLQTKKRVLLERLKKIFAES